MKNVVPEKLQHLYSRSPQSNVSFLLPFILCKNLLNRRVVDSSKFMTYYQLNVELHFTGMILESWTEPTNS